MTASGNAWRLKLKISSGGPAYSISGSPVTAVTIGDDVVARFTVHASAGTAPYVYALSSGTLPTGQTINSSTGLISGVITVAGTYSNIILKATDAASRVVYLAPYSVVVASPAADFTVTGSPTTTGTTGTALVAFTMGTVGATAPITWSFDTANVAPDGIVIGAANGIVSGTPTSEADGTYRCRIKAVDNLGGIGYSSTFTLVIRRAGAVLQTQPATYTQLIPATTSDNATFDLHGLSFTFNNSLNPNNTGSMYYIASGPPAALPPEYLGTQTSFYETGTATAITLNTYPYRPGATVNSTTRGGRFIGRFTFAEDAHITDWNPTYGAWTSTAAHVHEYQNGAGMLATSDPSTSLTIKRVRIHGCWDSIRPQGKAGLGASFSRVNAAGLCHHYFEDIWISDSFDDAIENDNCQSLDLTNVLIDGCGAGISMTPADSNPFNSADTDTLTCNGLLLRTRIRPNSGKISGPDTPSTRAPAYNDSLAPFKVTDVCPAIVMTNSIICFEFASTLRVGRWNTFWSKLTDGGNNKILYTGGDTMPSSSYIGTIAPGFTQQTGATAQATWDAAKAAFIAARPWIYKLDTD